MNQRERKEERGEERTGEGRGWGQKKKTKTNKLNYCNRVSREFSSAPPARRPGLRGLARRTSDEDMWTAASGESDDARAGHFLLVPLRFDFTCKSSNYSLYCSLGLFPPKFQSFEFPERTGCIFSLLKKAWSSAGSPEGVFRSDGEFIVPNKQKKQKTKLPEVMWEEKQ